MKDPSDGHPQEDTQDTRLVAARPKLPPSPPSPQHVTDDPTTPHGTAATPRQASQRPPPPSMMPGRAGEKAKKPIAHRCWCVAANACLHPGAQPRPQAGPLHPTHLPNVATCLGGMHAHAADMGCPVVRRPVGLLLPPLPVAKGDHLILRGRGAAGDTAAERGSSAGGRATKGGRKLR